VQWEKGGTEAATWKDVAIMKGQFLDFNLEDKVVSTKGIMLGFWISTIKKRDGRFIIEEN